VLGFMCQMAGAFGASAGPCHLSLARATHLVRTLMGADLVTFNLQRFG
jgi:hypothetical protein